MKGLAFLLLALAGCEVPYHGPHWNILVGGDFPCQVAEKDFARVAGLRAEGKLDRTRRLLEHSLELCAVDTPSVAAYLDVLTDLGARHDLAAAIEKHLRWSDEPGIVAARRRAQAFLATPATGDPQAHLAEAKATSGPTARALYDRFVAEVCDGKPYCRPFAAGRRDHTPALQRVTTVGFAADGSLLAAMDDQSVTRWPVGGSGTTKTTIPNAGGLVPVAFSTNGEALALRSDRRVRVVDPQTGASRCDASFDADISALRFTRDDSAVLVGTKSGQACFVSLQNAAPECIATGAPVNDLSTDSTGAALTVASDRGASIWDRRAQKQVAARPDTPVHSVLYLADDRTVALAEDKKLVRWDVASGITNGSDLDYRNEPLMLSASGRILFASVPMALGSGRFLNSAVFFDSKGVGLAPMTAPLREALARTDGANIVVATIRGEIETDVFKIEHRLCGDIIADELTMHFDAPAACLPSLACMMTVDAQPIELPIEVCAERSLVPDMAQRLLTGRADLDAP